MDSRLLDWKATGGEGGRGGCLPSSQWALERRRAAVSAPNSLPCTHTAVSPPRTALPSWASLVENNEWHPALWGGKEPQPQHRKNPPKRNHSRLQEESCPLQPLTFKGAEVAKADSRTFPGLQLTSDLSQTLKTPATAGRGTTQQGLQLIRLLRKARLVCALWPGPIKNCYVGVSPQATACNTTQTEKKAFQRAVKTAEKITRSYLPSVDNTRYFSSSFPWHKDKMIRIIYNTKFPLTIFISSYNIFLWNVLYMCPFILNPPGLWAPAQGFQCA